MANAVAAVARPVDDMPVDNAAIAALALAAAQKPPWHAPPKTDLGPKVTTQSQEGQYHPRPDVVQAALNDLTTAARSSALSARLAWVQKRKSAAETALTALGIPTTLPTTLALTPMTEWPLSQAGVRVRRPWFRLRAGLKESMQGEVFDTDEALAALSDNTVITTAAAQASLSAQLLLQMRCLADTTQPSVATSSDRPARREVPALTLLQAPDHLALRTTALGVPGGPRPRTSIAKRAKLVEGTCVLTRELLYCGAGA